MTAALTPYKNLQIVTPTPGGQAGAFINSNFTAIADQYKGAWSNSTAYPINSVVVYNNATYISKVANTNVTPVQGTTWDQIASITNATGNMLYRGSWSSSATYNPNDVVLFSGSIYINLTQCTGSGNSPSTASSGVWQQINLPSGVAFLGTWNNSTAYALQNVVVYNNVTYICTTANSNSAPPSSNWLAIGFHIVSGGTLNILNGTINLNNGSGTGTGTLNVDNGNITNAFAINLISTPTVATYTDTFAGTANVGFPLTHQLLADQPLEIRIYIGSSVFTTFDVSSFGAPSQAFDYNGGGSNVAYGDYNLGENILFWDNLPPGCTSIQMDYSYNILPSVKLNGGEIHANGGYYYPEDNGSYIVGGFGAISVVSSAGAEILVGSGDGTAIDVVAAGGMSVSTTLTAGGINARNGTLTFSHFGFGGGYTYVLTPTSSALTLTGGNFNLAGGGNLNMNTGAGTGGLNLNMDAGNINKITSAQLIPQSSAPSSPIEGTIYLDNAHNLKIYLNSTWKTFTVA